MSNLKNYLFTSESVSEGHPDKVSDRISDMVVDSFISGDPYSRVCLLYTSPSPRDAYVSRMPSSA